MHLLHQVLDEDGEIRDVAESLSQRTRDNPLKHALVLDLNPFWLAAYRFAEAGLDEYFLERLVSDRGQFLPTAALQWLRLSGGGVLDFRRRFKMADDLTEQFFGRSLRSSPFLFRIFALPVPNAELQERRRQLVGVAREAQVATVVETQPPATLVASPGDVVTSPSRSRGTLGGFLRDGPGGPVYATTCGHVISGGTASTPAGRLGPCVHAVAPQTLPSGVVCSTACGFMSDLDMALIDVGRAPYTNLATSVASVVSPGDLVDMDGGTSGQRRYEVGGAVVDHMIGGTCWSRLYLFHAPVSSGVLPVGVNVQATPPPKPGDSGAWLIRSGSEWAGMVVAANALHGFALAGTLLLNNGDAAFGTQLRLA